MAARHVGIDYGELCLRILGQARLGGGGPESGAPAPDAAGGR